MSLPAILLTSSVLVRILIISAEAISISVEAISILAAAISISVEAISILAEEISISAAEAFPWQARKRFQFVQRK
jgi:hypothetical protein